MSTGLKFHVAPQSLSEGSLEERAAFGLFTIAFDTRSVTEGFDFYLDSYRPGPLVSGYHVAEWLAWNWWRLRWESRSAAPDWGLVHDMTAIGQGYLWPNITIVSDGVRTALLSRPSVRSDAKPFRYIGAAPSSIESNVFEAALDDFIPRIIDTLRQENVPETNLDRLWRDIAAERADPLMTLRRRLEALMGREPDSDDDDAIDGLMADIDRLGQGAVEEVAADHGQHAKAGDAPPLDAATLEQLAQTYGFKASPRDALTLSPDAGLPRRSETPAWRLGAQAARMVRDEQRLGAKHLSMERLAEMAGTTPGPLSERQHSTAPLSFSLDDPRGSRIVLRSKWNTGRRFDVARLIGDRILHKAGALHPATRSYTYRQKAQRSFAAELLSPFAAVEDMLAGDYSAERRHEVAEHFEVSELTIHTLLVNHGRLEREVSDDEMNAAA